VSYKELALDEQFCFLVHRLDKAIVQKYRPLLRRLGITYPQYLVLLVLWEEDNINIGRLCKRLMLDTGTISPLIKRMEKSGLVERLRDPNDERCVHVLLSKKAKELEEQARTVPHEMATCIISALANAQSIDAHSLRETLRSLAERL
jgi:DNA-binding MarR family transcriptional regulator